MKILLGQTLQLKNSAPSRYAVSDYTSRINKSKNDSINFGARIDINENINGKSYKNYDSGHDFKVNNINLTEDLECHIIRAKSAKVGGKISAVEMYIDNIEAGSVVGAKESWFFDYAHIRSNSIKAKSVIGYRIDTDKLEADSVLAKDSLYVPYELDVRELTCKSDAEFKGVIKRLDELHIRGGLWDFSVYKERIIRLGAQLPEKVKLIISKMVPDIKIVTNESQDSILKKLQIYKTRIFRKPRLLEEKEVMKMIKSGFLTIGKRL